MVRLKQKRLDEFYAGQVSLNSTMVRLKLLYESYLKDGQFSLNSTMVRLKPINIGHAEELVKLCLNSTMVRLKHITANPGKADSFLSQFHYGSIKTNSIAIKYEPEAASQFHYGSIKT
ncbi:Hypothetical protein IALB_1219 [Ignavibacterium album JCM 16511]|uniref:Uncharacterized protein n=1 Tax=Ignavibacterium album (strain DSM 19864 / JCM 16511 / NBRC 101810 / Mat9-16) TaxID=945713 RepID=I0AIX3_IGNAJ|nr:Hypothetical protein IALB_1219 [Ignavibacterium album JCM 16511]